MPKALLARVTVQEESYLFGTNGSSADGPGGEAPT